MKKLQGALIALGIVLAFNVYPETLMAQNTGNACAQAQTDAQMDVNGTMWMAIGFLLGFPVGWPILPMVIEPSPPATRLMGKSPEYVATYTQCFKEAGKKIQQDKALIGCIAGNLVYVGCCALYYIAWGAAAATAY